MKKIVTLFLCATALMACKNETPTAEQNSDTEQMDTLTTTTETTGYQIGDVATDFSLIGTDEKMHSLADYPDAKGFVVIFTCNHCPYVIAYEDRIIALDKKYKELGYPVITINPNDASVQPEDSLDLMKVRAEEKGFTFPYLVDENQEIYPQYGATKTPHVFVLQKENEEHIVKYIGTIDNNYEDPNDVSERYVEDAVDALLAGHEIAVKETVAIGCTIKVKGDS